MGGHSSKTRNVPKAGLRVLISFGECPHLAPALTFEFQITRQKKSRAKPGSCQPSRYTGLLGLLRVRELEGDRNLSPGTDWARAVRRCNEAPALHSINRRLIES
jgi:hypothetical protein